MSRLLVLTTRELAVGYRLGGVAVIEVASPAETAARLEELLEREDGVIAVHAPYFHALDAPLRRRLDALRAPLVVALPAGTTRDEAEDRRERLLRMLRQAVGYEITFGDEGDDPMTTAQPLDRPPGEGTVQTRPARSGASPARSWSRAASTGCGCTTSCASAKRRSPARSSASTASRPRSRSTRTRPGLRVGEPVRDTGRPLEVELGPGLLGRIFDGTQRPLEVLARDGDDPLGRPLLPRGVDVPALDRERSWTFEPRVAKGDSVAAGDILGVVAETAALQHRRARPARTSRAS